MVIIFLVILFDVGIGAWELEPPPETHIVPQPWEECQPVAGSMDQNCQGIQRRTVEEKEKDSGHVVKSWREQRDCILTTEVINGGFTLWSAWDDCSNDCQGRTYKRRFCNNPTPCNGGSDCNELGVNQLQKKCGPRSGEWGEWGDWGSCQKPLSSEYGTGTYIRFRQCDNPAPACGGDYCIGSKNESGNCRVAPPCLTKSMFDERFLRKESPMVIYTSAQVDIYLLTKNKCAPENITYTYFELFKMNSTYDIETQIGQRSWHLKFSFDPGTLKIGLYRLYAKIGYPDHSMPYWMEESMYIKIEHPPPHAFIKGGVGKTVGKKQIHFDARSVSYSLEKGPGDPSGLTFRWKCLSFVTKSIYSLLQFNLDPVKAFNDENISKKKWYETDFTEYIKEQVAFINTTTLSERIAHHRKINTPCADANNLYVKVKPNSMTTRKSKKETFTDHMTEGMTYTTNPDDLATTSYLRTSVDFTYTVNDTNSSVTGNDILTTMATTLKTFDSIPLSTFYDITYMDEMGKKNPAKYDTSNVLTHPYYDNLVKNNFKEFLERHYGDDASSFATDTSDFFERLSESSLTLASLYELHELSGLPTSADEEFFNGLKRWLDIAAESKDFANKLVTLLDDLNAVQTIINDGLEVTDYIGTDGYFQLSLDSSDTCLINYLGDIFDGFSKVNDYDWHYMKQQEAYYLDWLDQELFTASACKLFSGHDNGTASLNVTHSDVVSGTGFLVYIRVEFEGSISYFIQHAQSMSGDPAELEVECKLNCMKKSALTSILSLKASCPSCTYEQLNGFKIWWNVKNFDIYNRVAEDNTDWTDWMLSELYKREFVMRANVMNASTGYLIEAFMQLENGQISTSIWLITTNILPYGGSCDIEDAGGGEWKVTTSQWKDEAFRNLKDSTVDWKEQLNYHIVQVLSLGKESLLYYGSEEENYIKVKPGIPEDNYNVTIKIQVFDIFIDYTECTKQLSQVLPEYTTGNDQSIAKFLQSSSTNIDYHWTTGNSKQVAMNTEVAAAPVIDLHNQTKTIFDTDPTNWVDLGVETDSNGTIITRSFEELWDMYQNPDRGDTTTLEGIMNILMIFSETLNNVSGGVESGSTVTIEQIANSIGTVLYNKDYTANTSASTGFAANKKLLTKFMEVMNNESYPKYEDFISTCEGVLRVLNNALEALLPRLSADTPANLDIYTVMATINDRQRLTQSTETDLTPQEKAFIASELAKKNELDAQLKNDIVKKEVQTLMESMTLLGDVIQMLNDRKQLPVYVHHGHINSTREKKLIAELVAEGFGNDDLFVDFRESTSRSTEEQNVQLNVYDHTPYSWDEESKYISSKTYTINVGTDNTTNTAIPSKLRIRNPNMTASVQSVTMAVPSDRNEFTSQMLLYSMYWQIASDTLIFSIANCVKHLNHVIYIRKKEHPTEATYDWKREIESSDWISSNTIEVKVQNGLYDEASLIHIAVLISSVSTVSNVQGRRKRSLIDIVEYQIVGFTTGCRVWDDNKGHWDNTSCQVSLQSSINETICECADPPGNSFVTTFYVPPNMIDFSTVFSKFNLKDNAAVFSTVICLVVVYLLICVWAFRQDKKDPNRWALSYLVDNSPTDDYLYILTVYTGLHRQAGTKSNISFLIIDGNTNILKSHVRMLDDEDHKGFGVGSVRRFVMSVSRKIQEPSILRIWHDNVGPGNLGSWYLNKVVLEDIQTKDRYLFICNQWLSLDHDDGSLQCTIPISNEKETSDFSFLFNENARESTTDSHLWLSVAIRPEESHFTRVQRLACCLTYLFLAMISNAMFFGQDTGSKISLGPISFSLSGIYISFTSALIAAPPIFLVTYIFRNSRRRPKKLKKVLKELKESTGHNTFDKIRDDENQLYSYSNLSLPFWCKYIAWLLITTAVLVSGFFLILYSMEWGKSKSEEWLLCFILSFGESLLIVDPLKIIVISVILSWIIKSKDQQNITYDKKKLLTETKQRAALQFINNYRGIQRKRTAPLKQVTITKLKKQRQAMLHIQRTLMELILYLVFLAVLFLVSFSNRDTEWINLTQHLKNQLISPADKVVFNKTTNSIRFNQVKSSTDLYDWVNTTLISFLFPRYYLNDIPLKANQRLYANDLVNFRVGPMRLRQTRTRTKTCDLQLWDELVCYSKYSVLDENDKNYCVGWENGPCPRGKEVYNKTSSAWTFVPALDVWGLPVTGYRSTYGGGGYIAEFIVNYNISKMILNDLYKYVWIDRKTRAVFTEFTLYNANDNVFVYCSFLCEFLDTGGVLTQYAIKPFRPYQHVGDLGVAIFVCELVVLVSMIIFGIRKVFMLRRHGSHVLKEVWNVLDLCIIILFIVCTIMYIGRWIMIDRAVDKFRTNKNKFVNFSHIAWWDELFNSILAAIIFLTTFRVMRVLSYNERMNQLGYVLSAVSRDLAGCFLMFLIVYTAFIIFGHLIFGRQLDTYKNLFVSSTTLTNAIIGKNSINDLFSVEPVLGRTYYFFFVLFLLWILMTMLNATLNVGITRVRKHIVHIPKFYGVSDILIYIWKSTVGLIALKDHSTKNNTQTTKSLNLTTKDVPKHDFKNIQEKSFIKRRRPKLIYQ